MPANYKEIAFETAIEDSLLENGYKRGDKNAFDAKTALFCDDVVEFIQKTQPELWSYLESIQKGKARETLIDDLCRALDSDFEGSLAVLRHGFKCMGKLFKMAYFEPASSMNPETIRLFESNILKVTRQLKYSQTCENSLDMVLSVNGIPVATLELKNQFSGQDCSNAINQYKNDRNPAELIFQFKKRALVHFAVDTNEVYMTTKLAGNNTFFLPFNQGSDGGAGNPLNPEGYETAYLWESILERRSLLDILARFVHLQTEEREIEGRTFKKEYMIFPRYHQLDCIRKVVADAKAKGAGTNYLIQHSAGSGKSNSIAWLAHRLASLFDCDDRKIFDSVVVVTDRLVLDQQLQNTVYQFEHKQGVVEKINENSTQLAQALLHSTPIIITTLQKFPFVIEKVDLLKEKNKRYAVIIDEAHSSQGGESAKDMKEVLGNSLKQPGSPEKEDKHDFEDELNKQMSARGKQQNISFFAFTATPKYKTLEVFGTLRDDGKPCPFHLYSMRQAIEEGFILDVLKNYTTYDLYFELIKSIQDDPQVAKKEASKALARFVSLHPHNISQKTEVIIEHFRANTMHKIGGKAKAMVVTSSRLHAVRYKQSFDNYIKERRYTNIKTLVAFSGTVIDPDKPDFEFTEVGMNGGIKEKELPAKFGTDDYQVLLVADKYQTGFDQPLLHTMYVDKRLSGVQAVQTLSRLNRIHDGKDGTFILDFVNRTEDILSSFQPYYEVTEIGERVKTGQLYDLLAKIMSYQVFDTTDIDLLCKIFFACKFTQTKIDHQKMSSAIDPSIKRFLVLEVEKRYQFKKTLIGYKNLYSFMSQIIPFQDTDLEKLYTFIRFLLLKLPKDNVRIIYDFDDEVAFKYYRLEKISDGSINLEKGTRKPVDGPINVGTGKEHNDKVELSVLINILNEKFGTDFRPGDQLFFDSIKEDALGNKKIVQAALANSIDNFEFVFIKELEKLLIERMEQNEEITSKYMSQDDFRKTVGLHIMNDVYAQINNPNS